MDIVCDLVDGGDARDDAIVPYSKGCNNLVA